jgi:hypothetical protein
MNNLLLFNYWYLTLFKTENKIILVFGYKKQKQTNNEVVTIKIFKK